jgi:hypothetical protein
VRQLLRDRFGRVGSAYTPVGLVTLVLSLTVTPNASAGVASLLITVGSAALLAGLVRVHRHP